MGQSPPSETYNYRGEGLPFFQGKAEFGHPHPTINKYCSYPNKIAKAGATLLSIRAPVGPTNLAHLDCCIGRGLAAFHPCGGMDPKFVLYLFRNIEPTILGIGTGSTFKAIGKRVIQGLKFDLPPLDEQRRIVAKIEALFSELDKGVRTLEAVRRQLPVYRQALLKDAFEGKLTAQWRAQNKDKLETPEQLLARIKRERKARYEEQLKEWKWAVKEWEDHGKISTKPSKPQIPKEPTGISDKITPKLPKLPAGWRWLPLGSIADIVGGITKNQIRRKLPHKMKYLRVANVYADMILTDNVHEIGVSKIEARKVALKVGDLLVVEGNGSIDQIGRVAMWNGELAVCGHQNHLIRVRIANGSNPRFSLRFLLSPQGRSLIAKEAKSTSGLHTLSISKVSNLNVPVASVCEEAEVLARVDEKLAGMDQAIELVDRQLAKAEALRQSILKKAFSGQLVPQDPDDEPASVLLDRIKAERKQKATSGMARRSTRKKRATA